MAVNDVFRVSVVMSVNSEPIINTFFFQETANNGTADEVTLGTAMNQAGGVIASLAGVLPSALSITTMLIQKVKPVGVVFNVAPVAGAGTQAGTWLPNQVATILTRKTATPGKGGRGRLFVSPVPSSFVSATNPGTLITNAYAALANAMSSGQNQGGYSFQAVLWKRKTLTALVLTGVNINLSLKTRRSRALGTRFHRRKRHTVGSI